jgi:hypothetical protein
MRSTISGRRSSEAGVKQTFIELRAESDGWTRRPQRRAGDCARAPLLRPVEPRARVRPPPHLLELRRSPRSA